MGEAITDSHLHLWDLTGGGYGWLEEAPRPLRRDARWEEAGPQHARLGVDRIVLVQADDTLADTRAMQAAAARIEADPGPVRRADVVAWLPLADPARAEQLLAEARAMDRVVGVRHLIHDDPDPGFLDRPPVRRSLALLAEHGLPLDVPDAFPRHLEQAARVAGEVDGLTIVLDHLGKPPLGDAAAMGRWERSVRSLAEHPSAVAKLSGLSTSGTGGQDPAGVRPAVETAMEAFGPRRLMFGSDWPIAPVPFDLASGTGSVLSVIRELEPEPRHEVLRGTAARVYRRRAG